MVNHRHLNARLGHVKIGHIPKVFNPFSIIGFLPAGYNDRTQSPLEAAKQTVHLESRLLSPDMSYFWKHMKQNRRQKFGECPEMLGNKRLMLRKLFLTH